jgi:hypothetical protein
MSHPSVQSTLGFLSLLITLTGCTEPVVGGVEPDGSAPNPGPTAIAMLGSSLPADPFEFLKGMQITAHPDTLYVFISPNPGQTCASPFLDDVPDCNDPTTKWQMVLGLPALLQTVGPLSLPATGVNAALAVSAGGPKCTGGEYPDGLTGDVAITSIDAQRVTLQFTGVAPYVQVRSVPPAQITAEYEASRCP